MSENKYPICGYAPGDYWHKACKTCGHEFTGDKRAWNCEPCGETVSAEMQIPLNDHDQIIANQVTGMPLEEAIFQSGFSRGHDIGYERGKREAQHGAMWVKASTRFPSMKHVVGKMYVSHLGKEVVGTAASTTGEMIAFDWGVSSVCLRVGHEELKNLQWLDESGTAAAGREEDAVELIKYIRENYKKRKDGWTDNFNIARLTDRGIYELYKQQKGK